MSLLLHLIGLWFAISGLILFLWISFMWLARLVYRRRAVR